MDQNPLLQTFDYPPFSKIENSHFKPAFEESLKEARTEINTIVDNTETPTFSNTIEALEFSGQKLGRISSIFFNLNSAETNTELQKLAQEISPLLSEFSNDLLLNADLFKKIKSVFKDKSSQNYTEEQSMLLEKIYKNFTRNGANLNTDDQKRLREIDMELSRTSLSFGENVLAETNNFELLVKDKSELDGIPDDIKESEKP
jgi:Zn-dependent oligopeptidase